MASGEGVGEIIPWKNNLVDSVLLFSFFPHTPSLSFPSSKLFFLLPHPPLTLLYSFHLHLNTQHHNFALLPSFPCLLSFPSFIPHFQTHLLSSFLPTFFFYFNLPSPSYLYSLPTSHAPSASHFPTSSPSSLRSSMFIPSLPLLPCYHFLTVQQLSPLIPFPFRHLLLRHADSPTNNATHTHTHTHTLAVHLNCGVPGPLLLQQCPLHPQMSHLLVSF